MPDSSVVVEHPEPRAWPWWVRVGFRFSFLYWALYMLPSSGAASLIDVIPWGNEKLAGWVAWPMMRLAHVVGVHVFHLTGEGADWHPTGSGDTAMNYVMLAVMFALALVGAAVWSAIAEIRGKRMEYRTAYAWLRLALRFTLAITMFEYGFAKIFPGQFGLQPGLAALNESYGESSPMHVLWFFMGISRPYTIFGGFMEVIPGVLLLFRRTSTVGLLGALAVMVNVMALNFCYDVPVKLYSTHLVLMALFLLLPDMRPMWEFFVRRRSVELTGVWLPVWERKSLRMGSRVLQVLFVVACAWSFVGGSYTQRTLPRAPSPLQGVWAVDGSEGWAGDKPKTMVLDGTQYVTALLESGTQKHFPVEYNAAKREMRFTNHQKETVLRWDWSEPKTIEMSGKWNGSPVTLHLHRTNPDVYPLLSRGFHWVQERAFNQ